MITNYYAHPERYPTAETIPQEAKNFFLLTMEELLLQERE